MNVWVWDGRPVRFVWRGRLYPVLRVLEHWVASREWWKQLGEEDREAVPAPEHARCGPIEHEFWRVEASPGQNTLSAIYELRLDAATGNWLLARVWD